MSVSCECCVLSGRGLCVGLITRLEESCRMWWAERGREDTVVRRPFPLGTALTALQFSKYGPNWTLKLTQPLWIQPHTINQPAVPVFMTHYVCSVGRYLKYHSAVRP